MDIKGWLRSAWNYVRRLPIGRYLKSIWKPLLKELVQAESDKLQEETKAMVRAKGPGALNDVNARVDKWQAAIVAGLDKVPFPKVLEDRVRAVVQDGVDYLQGELSQRIGAGAGDVAIDLVFDNAEIRLAGAIDLL